MMIESSTDTAARIIRTNRDLCAFEVARQVLQSLGIEPDQSPKARGVNHEQGRTDIHQEGSGRRR